VAGHDQARDAVRVFRLSRIEGPVGFSGPRGAVKVPDGVDLRELVAEWDSHPAEQQAAALKIRAGTGLGLPRRATRAQPGAAGGRRAGSGAATAGTWSRCPPRMPPGSPSTSPRSARTCW